MAEEIKKEEVIEDNESKQKNVPDSENYIKAIKEIKTNTVSKEAYKKLEEENKQLLDTIVNGKELPDDQKPNEVKVEDVRNKLFNEELNNLEFVKNALLLRKMEIEKGNNDPFVATGKKIIPTEEDYQTAQRVADSLEECVENADGDSEIFTRELQRIMVDTGPHRIIRSK